MFKRSKPNKKSTFEEAIQYYLEGDLRDSALAFAAWAKTNGFAPRQWNNPDCWKIPQGEVHLCMMQFDPGQWRFTFFAGDYSGDYEEGFVKAVQNHVETCRSCHDGCTKGIDMTVFGKEFANVCSQLSVQFENPDANTLAHIKQLLEYWKTAGHTSESWHYRH